MAYQPSYDTDDSAVPAAVRIFFKRRLFEVAGVVLFLALIADSLSLASWSVDDPSLNHALDRAARALREFHVGPIKTTIPLHQRLVENTDFRRGGVDIHYLERLLKNGM